MSGLVLSLLFICRPPERIYSSAYSLFKSSIHSLPSTTMQTKKRSHTSNSQTSPNIADSKRRKKEMDDNAWEQWDETLLQMLGDVRHNVDTTMGKKYTEEFYLNLAKRMSEVCGGIPFSGLDIGKRVCWFRNMYRSYSEDRCHHAVMTPARFQSLLRLCFYEEIKPIRVPLSLSGRRSTRRGAGYSGGSRESGGSSHSVGQQAADSQSLSGVLAHLRVNYRDRVNANRLFYFTRLVDANPSIIPLFMGLPTHEERLQFLEDLDMDPYIPRAHN